jgi:Putative small multi-drug export protein
MTIQTDSRVAGGASHVRSHQGGDGTSPAPDPAGEADGQVITDDQLLHHEAKFADEFRREYPLIWWATLVGPFIVTGAMLAYLWFERGGEFVAKLLGTALATFFGLGRFVILFGSDMKDPSAASHAEEASRFNFMTSSELFTMVTWMDLFAACLLIFHAGFLYRIPKLGPGMVKLREEGEFFMKTQPWMRRFTFIGVALFVAFPLAATGSIAGSIFGRLLGMSRKATLAALVAGTLLGNGAMFLGSELINKIPFFDKDNPLNLVGGLAVIVGIIVFLNWRYQKFKKQFGGVVPK